MDIARVRNLQTIFNRLVTEVQVVVLDFEGFLQVGESRAQFLGSSEDAGEVVVSHRAVPIALVGVGLGFLKQLESNSVVF